MRLFWNIMTSFSLLGVVQSPTVLPPPIPSEPTVPPVRQISTSNFPPTLVVGQRWEFRLSNRPIVYRGVINGQDNRSGSAVFIGTLHTDGVGDPIGFRNLETPFTATLTVRRDYPPPPVRPQTVSFPPKQGQRWLLSIEGTEPSWLMEFFHTRQTFVSGTAGQGSVVNHAFAFVINGQQWFQVFGENLVYFCVFPANPHIDGTKVGGGQAFIAPTPSAALTPLNRACSAALNGLIL